VHVEYSHWLHENYSPKTISHHFWPRLMEGNGSMGVYSNTPWYNSHNLLCRGPTTTCRGPNRGRWWHASRPTPPMICRWICKLKLDEKKSKHVGLAQQNGFGPTLGLGLRCSEVPIFAGRFSIESPWLSWPVLDAGMDLNKCTAWWSKHICCGRVFFQKCKGKKQTNNTRRKTGPGAIMRPIVKLSAKTFQYICQLWTPKS